MKQVKWDAPDLLVQTKTNIYIMENMYVCTFRTRSVDDNSVGTPRAN